MRALSSLLYGCGIPGPAPLSAARSCDIYGTTTKSAEIPVGGGVQCIKVAAIADCTALYRELLPVYIHGTVSVLTRGKHKGADRGKRELKRAGKSRAGELLYM